MEHPGHALGLRPEGVRVAFSIGLRCSAHCRTPHQHPVLWWLAAVACGFLRNAMVTNLVALNNQEYRSPNCSYAALSAR